MILPEVHNPPSLFGGEFHRRRGFTIQGLEAMGAANVRRLPTHPVEDEIEMKGFLFADQRSTASADPVVVDRRKIVSELEVGGEPRRNRAEDWTARHGLAEHFVGQLALLADVRELEEARYCELALVP